jgi:hypothetical protein
MKSKEKKSTEISFDNGTVCVKIRFYVDDMPGATKGEILPKRIWAQGTLTLIRNDRHGIMPEKHYTFNHLIDMMWKLNCAFRDAGIEVLDPRTFRELRRQWKAAA